MSGWRPALQARRVGAAHRRQGRPCQDAVAVCRYPSRDGQPVQVMAVADGHGGEHYLFSDVGSALACDLALQVAGEHLGLWDLQGAQAPGLDTWAHWLSSELPQRIHSRWLALVREHWQRHTALSSAPDQAPSSEVPLPEGEVPRLYGTTLGLVVLAPRWWGYTGLGDWDLVQVGADGQAALLSEETAGDGGGEATGSLCLEQAAGLFRSGLEPIEHPEATFGLLLSTDGIRKSCATDTDFLLLAAHLIATPAEGASEVLATNLDQITSEGSGDDVSVAIAQHGSLCTPSLLTRSQVNISEEKAPGDLPIEAMTIRAQKPLLLGALLVATAGLGAGWYWLQHWSMAPAPPSAVRRQINQLCQGPANAIAGTLSNRRSQFTDLRQGRLTAPPLLDSADLDPLGALIARSFDPASGGMVQGEALTALGLCPLLAAALQRQWQPPDHP
ncbi:protein phosphatase 2C domain-containing protein [Synechococcus sp. Cruz-9H2]|uniref:protein phosphatase 2C domain-containing protein n=1 Tax=unclassified Synechococcus TaxID=2626047 RepID=UPI0020CDAD7B|nr:MULTISPECIES: protein phosphatase 2C domain-containing protein [unclassified Synechococcus]MCP9819115.1 protein phosphatase 2C domain-containing protein [Synechococcus sp. Cruz-9H2]MCP9843619.1 protein phosphatase 2C domain-containing protein [Synechococcus sp. Edmonson 11F2]MCP9855662.1 protein phosphatase 2C domain-containing protein [Synechococcus sp. Cruz-9C9]MCP9863100.1 protein phosphatase 2C domain-containing protein [Synechococcus sp. Cruz-7E5]MCP9870025.1 protein phosphatase 2C dom